MIIPIIVIPETKLTLKFNILIVFAHHRQNSWKKKPFKLLNHRSNNRSVGGWQIPIGNYTAEQAGKNRHENLQEFSWFSWFQENLPKSGIRICLILQEFLQISVSFKEFLNWNASLSKLSPKFLANFDQTIFMPVRKNKEIPSRFDSASRYHRRVPFDETNNYDEFKITLE